MSSTRIIKRSDGTIEKHQTFKDNDGNEQTIVRRQIGDKVHELITNRNKAGNETTTENFININESKKQKKKLIKFFFYNRKIVKHKNFLFQMK